MSTMDQQPRHGRRVRPAALLCGSLVFAAALAIALLVVGGGERGWGRRPGQPQEHSTPPLVATPEGAGPAPAAAVGVYAPVIQPVPLSPARPAATAPVAPPASKPTAAAEAAALVGASTQDALNALTAAAAATAAKGSGGEADKQQEQAQTGGGTCRVETAEELTDAVEVGRYVPLDRIIPHPITTNLNPNADLQNGPCAVILLTSPDREAYVLEREVNVTRRVTVMGNPAWLPQIDAHSAVRAFHVLVRAMLVD